jgi:hypothetical protein
LHKQNISPEMSNLLEKLGYWLVDQNLVFVNKAQALMHCTAHNTTDIKYCLGTTVFGAQDWSIEPAESLLDLYKKRARQLREKYDYVILAYSGGSDSTCVLHSFIDNDILPDEVITWTLEGPGFSLKDTTHNKELYHARGLVKEHIINRGITFTTLDSSYLFNDHAFAEDWCVTGDHMLRVGTLARYKSIYKDRYRQLKEKGLTCCVVYGMEKPNVHNDDDGNLFCVFQDSNLASGVDVAQYSLDYDAPSRENFFVTSDLPELTIKQSHLVADELMNRHKIENLDLKIGEDFHWRPYKKHVIDILYGHCFDRKKAFSIGKNSSIFGYRDDWIWNLPNEDLRKQKVISGLGVVMHSVDAKWFNKRSFYEGFIGCITDRYYLGKNLWK